MKNWLKQNVFLHEFEGRMKYGSCWLGLTDILVEGTWQWMNGWGWPDMNDNGDGFDVWIGTSPDDHYYAEDCVYVHGTGYSKSGLRGKRAHPRSPKGWVWRRRQTLRWARPSELPQSMESRLWDSEHPLTPPVPGNGASEVRCSRMTS